MNTPIIDALINYKNEGNTPFHMPGHKNNKKNFPLLNKIRDNLYDFDLTEVDGVDDMHCPEECILESLNQTAKCYGASNSFYLVNGSTSGIYAMILSLTERGDKVIVQRNCHRSVYMACYMGGLKTEYLTPTVLEDFDFAASLNIENVKNVIEKNKDAKAIILTSPTYYGTCCNVKAIKDIAKKYGIMVLVDAAHGAHFPFSNALPSSSLNEGADMETVSFHKTLPSFTQTAVLNVKNHPNIEKLKFMLRLYQSTSPSYIFMASIEAGRAIMEEKGEALLGEVTNIINDFKKKIKKVNGYKVLDSSFNGKKDIYDIDETRIVINSPLKGTYLSEILRKEYNIQVEMSDEKNIVLIGCIGDTIEMYDKLYFALLDISEKYNFSEIENTLRLSSKHDIYSHKNTNSFSEEGAYSRNNSSFSGEDAYSYISEMTIYEGYNREKEAVNLDDSLNRVSGEIIAPYPPGIPILLPGERITNEKINIIKKCKSLNIKVNGIEDSSLETIKVIK